MKQKKEGKNIIFNILFAVLTLVFMIIFYKNILLTTILVGIVSIIGLVKWKSKLTLIIFVIGGIFGTIVEIIAISYGVWNYSVSNILNIPSWLFLAWGNASAFLYQTAIEIKRLGVRK